MISQLIDGEIQIGSLDAQGNVHIGHQIVHNYYVSTDWKKLQQRLTDALENFQSFPEHPKFAQQLKIIQDEIESFKRDVLKLAQDFQKLSLHTERLKQAKAYFDQGYYEKARAVLDTAILGQEQAMLLAEQDVLDGKLAANADEFILLARLTALNFELGEERTPKTCAAFESALKSQRTFVYLSEYARFLQEEKLLSHAENYYREAINHYQNLIPQATTDTQAIYTIVLGNLAALIGETYARQEEAETIHHEAFDLAYQLALQENRYTPHLTQLLNNRAILVGRDTHRHLEAETLYRQAVEINRYLVKSQPQPSSYESSLALTLSNLGSLISNDPSRRVEAEQLFLESLGIYRRLSETQLDATQPKIAITLVQLAILLSSDQRRILESKQFYIESLSIYHRLARQKPAVYEPLLATVMYNVANLALDSTKERSLAEYFYQESLALRRRCVKHYPGSYEFDLGVSLSGLGVAYIAWNESRIALPYLEEAFSVFQALYKLKSSLCEEQYLAIQTALGLCRRNIALSLDAHLHDPLTTAHYPYNLPSTVCNLLPSMTQRDFNATPKTYSFESKTSINKHYLLNL